MLGLLWWAGIEALSAKPVGLFGSGTGATDVSHIVQLVLADRDTDRHFEYIDAGPWIEPANYSQYSAIIASRLTGSGSRSWTPEEIDTVEAYLRDGGVLILLGTSANTLGRGRNLNRIGHLIGAVYFSRGSTGTILQADHPLLAGVDLHEFGWRSGSSLSRLNGAEALVGEPDKAAVAWFPVGEGGILFIGQEFFRIHQRSNEEGTALGQIIRNTLQRAGTAQVSSVAEDSSGWGLEPLGQPAEKPPGYNPPVRRELKSNRKLTPLEGAPVVLAVDGVAVTAIVLPSDASRLERQAATILQTYLGNLIGMPPTIVAEDQYDFDSASSGSVISDKPVESVIFVGNTRAAAAHDLSIDGLPAGGYFIRATDGKIYILGNNRSKRGKEVSGVVYGALALLENHLGVRWLWPGPGGTVLPRSDNLEVPAFEETDSPAVAHRTIRYSSGSPGREISGLERLGLPEEAYDAAYRSPWLTRARLGSSLNLSYGHAYGGWWNRHGETHPEWFALQPDGTRQQVPARERLCKSNPQLAEQVALEINQQLRDDPTRDAASISPNDGSAANFFCMCPECRKLDPPNGDEVEILFVIDGVRHWASYPSLTDRVMTFYNRIAEQVAREHPDRLLGAYAYSRYRSPPLDTPVPGNLLIGFVGVTYFDEYRRKLDLARWDGWAEKARHIFFRPNLLLEGMGLPAVYSGRLAEDLKHFYQTGLIGVDYSRIIHNWSTQGVNYYVLSKLLWDPSLDPDEIIDDYCRSGFGPAAGPVREYFSQLEEMTTRIADLVGERHAAQVERELREIEVDFNMQELPPPSRELATIEVFTPEAMAGLNALLEEAWETTSDPEIRERINFLRIGLEYAQLQITLYRLQREEDTREVREQAREILSLRQDLFQQIMAENPFAVGVVWILWRENVRWERAFNWTFPAQQEQDT